MTDTTVVPPADMMTEQEKDTASPTKGVGPASASEVSPGPVETMEALGIGPREPYPEGNPPPPSDADLANIERAKKAPEAKQVPNVKKEPAATKGPAHPASDAFGNPIPPKGGA
jgi:hypothetical protein